MLGDVRAEWDESWHRLVAEPLPLPGNVWEDTGTNFGGDGVVCKRTSKGKGVHGPELDREESPERLLLA